MMITSDTTSRRSWQSKGRLLKFKMYRKGKDTRKKYFCVWGEAPTAEF
jgi:hypothetical protein